MKTERRWRLLLFATLILSLTIPFLLQASEAALENWDYATSDGISRAAIDTKRILRRYEATNDTREITDWISNGPAEAHAAQMCMTLANWATNHQTQFLSIVQSLPPRKQEQFIEVFCASLASDTKAFRRAFQNDTSPLMKKILANLA